MLSQKARAKKYKEFHGKPMKVWVGRVPSQFKHVEYEISLCSRKNGYGKYEEKEVVIKKTSFNGKLITIDLDIELPGVIREFKVTPDAFLNSMNHPKGYRVCEFFPVMINDKMVEATFIGFSRVDSSPIFKYNNKLWIIRDTKTEIG